MKVLNKIKLIANHAFLVLLLLFFLNNCASLNMAAHDGFYEWFIGKPGYWNGMTIEKEPFEGTMVGERHPYYLWLRTPEIIFNPQGGLYYPDMIAKDYRDGKFYNTAEISNITDKAKQERIFKKRNNLFMELDIGLVDYLIGYRDFNDPNGEEVNACFPFRFIALPILPIWSFLKTFKYIYYPIHDVVKVVLLPVAGVYYTVKAYQEEEEE